MPRDIAISKLHPTQLTLGLSEVEERAAKIRRKSKDGELVDYLSDKAVPFVIGPGQQIYMTDHHHLARALLLAGQTTVLIKNKEEADWSDLDLRTFWTKMEGKGWCWPIDADGNRRAYADIPANIEALTDNPWRSLARRVRDKAFKDDDTPFQEFMWGDYFRTFMTRRLITEQPNLADTLAVDLARLPDAEDLPGFKGNKRIP